MVKRIDQQILVNKIMIDSYSLPKDVKNKRLAQYMLSYLAMISCVTSVMLILGGTQEHEEKRREFVEIF